MQKRGQAAMEFLMTYGWAILAAIIVIAVLAIYFRPSSLTSGSSVVTAPFYAVGSVISPTQIQLEVRNNGGENLGIVDVNLTVTNPTGGGCNNALDVNDFNINNGTSTIPPSAVPFTLSAGGEVIIDFDTCTGIDSGDSVSADVKITYTRPDSSLSLTSTGTVSGTAA